ncbi:MAG: 3-phosphoshikimate 1-carboxyvinyltransferase [Gemmatimonadota bacterium]|nr:3-phosphoshikimate 1-carboxyvinyltransferase [Gemmatimonadota bacterium]
MTEIRVPGDKSLTQRALILASLAEGTSVVSGLLHGGDASSTAGALRALGVEIPRLPPDGSPVLVPGVGLRGLRAPGARLDLGNSGTGARLLLGVLAGSGLTAEVTGDDSLRSRPMARVTEPLSRMGAGFTALGVEGRLPLRVEGKHPLHGLEWDSPVASAQVKSALLLAGLTGRARVLLGEPRRSRDHTERMLTMLGVGLEETSRDGRWCVEMSEPPEHLPGFEFHVPGDFSSAAFVLGLGVLGGSGGSLTVADVGLNPTRTAFLDILSRMGADLKVEPDRHGEGEPRGSVTVAEGRTLSSVEVGEDEVPALIDEIPLIAALASRAQGTTTVTGAGELRHKESDRIASVVSNLRALGVDAEELADGLRVTGSERPLAGRVTTHGDHRIAMAFGVLGALPGNTIVIDEPEAADVSFPGFWGLLADLSAGKGDTRGSPRGGRAGRPPIVTLDGPAGSGKSSTAAAVARALGFRHLDSGALYRALTFSLLREGVPPGRWETLTEGELRALPVSVHPTPGGFAIEVDGISVGEELRTPEVTAHVSHLAGLPAVRGCLLDLQRAGGAEGGLVADGRDMGSVVFPDAEVKVFLVADLQERARRRLLEREGREPTESELSGEVRAIAERDRRDSDRTHSPLVRPAGALDLDTTALSFQEQVDRVVQRVRELTDRNA